METVIAWVIAAVALLGAAFVRGQVSQKRKQEMKDLKAKRKADEIAKKVDALSDDDIRSRASKWLRNR